MTNDETDEIDVTDTQAIAEAKKRISEPIPWGRILDPMYGFNWVDEPNHAEIRNSFTRAQ